MDVIIISFPDISKLNFHNITDNNMNITDNISSSFDSFSIEENKSSIDSEISNSEKLDSKNNKYQIEFVDFSSKNDLSSYYDNFYS